MLTIIITTYSRTELFRRALLSALHQTADFVRVLVLDDASEDGTKEVVEELKKVGWNIEYVRHSKRIGMLRNYQFGLARVETEFFTFLSDDDYLLPSYAQIVMEGFSKFPDIAFFAASTICLSENYKVVSVTLDQWPREGIYNPPEGFLQMLGKIPIPNTICFRKSRIQRASIDFRNQPVWDWDFILQIGGQFPFAISKKPGGILFGHPQSFTIKTPREWICQCHLRLMERIDQFAFLSPQHREKGIQHYKQEYLKLSLKYLIEQIQFDLAYKNLKELLGNFSGTFSNRLVYAALLIWVQLPLVRKLISPARTLQLKLKLKFFMPSFSNYLKKRSLTDYFKIIHLQESQGSSFIKK